MLDKAYSSEQVIVAALAAAGLFLLFLYLVGFVISSIWNAFVPGLGGPVMSIEWGAFLTSLGWAVGMVIYAPGNK